MRLHSLHDCAVGQWRIGIDRPKLFLIAPRAESECLAKRSSLDRLVAIESRLFCVVRCLAAGAH